MKFQFVVALAIAIMTSNNLNTAAAQSGATPTTLRQAADKRGFLIGAAVNPDLLSQPDYARTLSEQFNTVVAENAMKFASVQPREGKFDFAAADKLVAFAQKNNMRVRGHALVWHSQVSDWVTEARCKDAEKILRAHITTVAGHFKGKVFAWDVVNEGLDEDGSLRDTFWARCIGPDYIEKAFRWAHAADPKAKLFYNDYGIESEGVKARRAYDLVSDLKKRGVPIHGVGLQMHLDRIISDVFVARYMQQFADLGLEVHITEMDVRLPEPAGTRDVLMQTEAYRMIARRCVQAKNCTALLTWGVSDRYSWIPDFFPGYGSALLFDKEYQPKPAFKAVLSELTK
jgi:endo-1,4-beta-xylanase